MNTFPPLGGSEKPGGDNVNVGAASDCGNFIRQGKCVLPWAARRRQDPFGTGGGKRSIFAVNRPFWPYGVSAGLNANNARNPEAGERFAQRKVAWLSGEKVDGLSFLHNSIAEVTLPDGTTKIGWIVAATVDGPEPVYTVEAQDGSDDIVLV